MLKMISLFIISGWLAFYSMLTFVPSEHPDYKKPAKIEYNFKYHIYKLSGLDMKIFLQKNTFVIKKDEKLYSIFLVPLPKWHYYYLDDLEFPIPLSEEEFYNQIKQAQKIKSSTEGLVTGRKQL